MYFNVNFNVFFFLINEVAFVSKGTLHISECTVQRQKSSLRVFTARYEVGICRKFRLTVVFKGLRMVAF